MSKVGLIILTVIFILVLISVIIIFVFDFNPFKEKEKERILNYREFLFSAEDLMTRQQINSNISLYGDDGKSLMLTSKKGIFEKVNLSIDKNIITKQRECWMQNFFLFKKQVCGDKKLAVPIAYSTYCIEMYSPGYYNNYSCINLTGSSKYQQVLTQAPVGVIKMVSPGFLRPGDGTEEQTFSVYISNVFGELRDGVICLDYSLGIIKAWLDEEKMEVGDIPKGLEVKKCYYIERDLKMNESYSYLVHYKSSDIYPADFINITLLDKDYVSETRNYEYFWKDIDLGIENQFLEIR